MRYIFIVLFLVSFGSISMGGVGDVYFCDEKQHMMIKDHKLTKYKLGKFKFKMDPNHIGFKTHPKL